MSIEPRSPPPQLAAKLQRAFGGRAGWGGFVLQLLFVAALAWIGYEIVANARANLQAQRITAGFGFLANTAGFDVSQNLIPYSGSDPYTRVFLVGLLNTLLVSIIGIFFATVIGFLVALGRLSPNCLLSRISGVYVELIRNLCLLAIAALRAPAAVRERQIGQDLALCGGPADRAAAIDRAFVRCARRL